MMKVAIPFILIFLLIFILYMNGFIPITVKSSVMFIGGLNGKKARFTSCNGYMKRIVKLKTGRKYRFSLNSKLVNGSMAAELIGYNKQRVLLLNEFISQEKLSVDRTGRYTLILRFHSATGEYELNWNERDNIVERSRGMKMKRWMIILSFGMFLCFLSSCEIIDSFIEENPDDRKTSMEVYDTEEDVIEQNEDMIIPEERTILTRIKCPEGFKRISFDGEKGSFTDFLRDYPLKEWDSPVLLYNEKQKANQNVHIGVFELPIEKEDLQQCADSIMRMYAEYFWSSGQHDRIMFHLSDGFELSYSKWREGYRVGFENDKPYWYKKTDYDDSYETFVKYMRIVFAYAGTASMEALETRGTRMEQLKPGDVFIKGGSPGHVVMVVDVCENEEGKKAFLLAQGYMPAQEFHLLKNPLHQEDPWYYEDEITYPLRTPEYTFEEGSLRSLCYLED